MTMRWITPICLLLVLMLSACGGEETPTPEPTATPTVALAPPEAPTNTPTSAAPPTETPIPADTPTPVAEAESVLATPLADVSILPTPTLAPPLAADPCEEELVGQDAQIAEAYPVLGCPQGAPDLVDMARQPFQHGLMIWRSDTGTIYVLNNDGTWRSFEDTFAEGQPEADPTLAVPEGSFQPIRGFGKVWRQQLGGPDAAIGWAVLPEGGASGTVQDWEHGTFIGFGLPERYVIFDDGRWEKVE